ncbi:hypothetical protein OROGR_031643 [Orobanche gracilis]
MGRSPCCEKAHTNKGAWTKEEDDRLIAYIRAHGEGCWRSLPKSAGLLRCGKSCRLRWINYLRPDLKRGNFTEDEDEIIIKLHSLLGNKWSLIAGKLPGRTDNEIKNYWNTHIRRKLLSHGIDPTTHRPMNEAAAAAAPSPETTSISFPGAVNSKELLLGELETNDAVIITPSGKTNNTTSSNIFSSKQELENSPVRDLRCLDLNLELRISPPYQQQNQEPFRTDNYRSNNNNNNNNNNVINSSKSNFEYDFLGLMTGVLDYRSLEM